MGECIYEFTRTQLWPQLFISQAIKYNHNCWIRKNLAITTTTEYGPVTMIVLASGHQVRCIPWVQMGTFNKEIGFLCGLKFFALNIFCGEYLQ